MQKFKLVSQRPDDCPLPSSDAVGFSEVDEKIHVFTEWAPVTSVILGYMGQSSNICKDDPLIMTDSLCLPDDPKFSPETIKRSQEIQNFVAEELIKRGINVLRVGVIDCKAKHQVGDKMIDGFHTFSSRDLIFFYHDTAYEVPSITVSRQHEHPSFYWILDKLRTKGSKWYTSWVHPYSTDAPLFDAANIMRAGLDILFQISLSGTEEGYLCFKNFMDERYQGKVRVHPMYVYDGVHIDTTLVVLGFNQKIQKFIVLANPDRITPQNIPVLFRGKHWAVLYAPKPVDQGFADGICMASDWIALNIFVLNSHLVMMDDAQPEFAKLLKFYGIESIQVKHELGKTVCGAFHCMTNEFRRDEDFDFEKVLDDGVKLESLSSEETACYFDPEHLEFFKSKSSDLSQWVKIANEHNIFPTILTDHLEAF